MEELIVALVRYLHIACGATAIVIAPLAMVAAKGGDRHRLWGKIFFYAMALVALTALVLAIYGQNLFLGLLALFSFHLVASGYRALYHKRVHEGQKPSQADLLLQGGAGVINGGFFTWGVVHLLLGHRGAMPIVFIVFGSIGGLMVWRNMQRFYKRTHDKHEWLYAHMGGFLGGYIATLTAFSVTNMEFIRPSILQWLWPSLIGVPLIILWTRYYKQRLTKGRRARSIMDIRIK